MLSVLAIILDPDQPVPVPQNDDFSCGVLVTLLDMCGPAGATSASELILSLINLLLGIIGLLTVLFLIIGGARYITAHGNEEQAEGAKKTLTHAVIGLVIVILSFAVVNIIADSLING